GLGRPGLKLLAKAREETGLLVCTEAMDPEGVAYVAEIADIIQIGARNMQNSSLLKAAGRAKKAVLLKRGMSATIEELLLSAEYVLAEGNHDVILCERGIRGFDTATRNVFDLTAIPVVHKLSHLPIIADPSHGTGLRDKVIPMARAAVAAGADGIIVEVHPNPDQALSDGAQTLFPDQFAQLMREIRVIAAPDTTHGRLYQMRPSRFAMRFTAPKGDRIVADGRFLWLYTPSTTPGQVIRSRIPDYGTTGPNLIGQFVERPHERYTASY